MTFMIEDSALPTLLWNALRKLQQASTEEGSLSPPMPSLDMWANLLRAVNETGTDVRDLPRIVCLSKRAVRSRLVTAVRHGWLKQMKSGRGRTMVPLTSSGCDAAAR